MGYPLAPYPGPDWSGPAPRHIFPASDAGAIFRLVLEALTRSATAAGLVVRGGFEVGPGDAVPDSAGGETARSLVLFGNAGSGLWPEFSGSAEFADGRAHPLNRWSERVGAEMAVEFGGWVLFPFGGPPYQPFLKWAKKGEGLHNSRLGMLIHPEYGLWHAYRFAIAFADNVEMPAIAAAGDICAQCRHQRCLQACPVAAFSEQGYEVSTCYDFLRSHPDSACRDGLCQARAACPEGREFRYESGHGRFHMDAFMQSIAAGNPSL